MTQDRKNQVYEKMLSWVFEHVKNDKELFRILHEEFEMTQEEFHDNGIDSLDYLFEAQKVDETVGKIGVFHLHQDEDDYHFANEYNNTFYRAVKLYQRFKEQEENHLTIDTVALMYFGAQQSIDPLTFDVLVNAIEHDDRVNVIVEIDLNEGMMSVKDKSGVWKTYRLDDILYAVDIVDRNAGKAVNSFSERMFSEIMAGSEVERIAKKPEVEETQASEGQIPTM